MTIVNGVVSDTSGRLLNGVLTASSGVFRADGSVVYAPEQVPYRISNGEVTADLAPGPARLTIQTSGPPRAFTAVIPEQGTVTLASLIGDS